MKSIHSRLDDKKETVLDVTHTFGRFRAMEQFHISDYVCFCRWLKEVTGDENFGANPKINLDGHRSLGDQLVEAFLRKVAILQTDNERLKQRIDYLEWQLSTPDIKEQYQSLAILQSCEVS